MTEPPSKKRKLNATEKLYIANLTDANFLQGDSESNQSDDEHRAAVIIQKIWRGYLARKHIRIRTLAEGIVHVAIKGDSELLASIGVDRIETAGPKTIDYVSIDPSKFDMHLAGGDEEYKSFKQAFGRSDRIGAGLKIVRELFDENHPGRNSDSHVVINGGCYNVKYRSSQEAPQHAPIGKTHIANKSIPDGLRIPSGYEDYFTSINFEDGSRLVAGPSLYEDGEIKFGDDLLEDARFQWRDGMDFKPGMLRHAQHPNQRSAIILPDKEGVPGETATTKSDSKADRFRVVLASADNGLTGPDQNGLNMAELARFAEKMALMNNTAGSRAVNLDGGQSSQLYVLQRRLGPMRVKLLNLPKAGLPAAANFIVFSKRKMAS